MLVFLNLAACAIAWSGNEPKLPPPASAVEVVCSRLVTAANEEPTHQRTLTPDEAARFAQFYLGHGGFFRSRAMVLVLQATETLTGKDRGYAAPEVFAQIVLDNISDLFGPDSQHPAQKKLNALELRDARALALCLKNDEQARSLFRTLVRTLSPLLTSSAGIANAIAQSGGKPSTFQKALYTTEKMILWGTTAALTGMGSMVITSLGRPPDVGAIGTASLSLWIAGAASRLVYEKTLGPLLSSSRTDRQYLWHRLALLKIDSRLIPQLVVGPLAPRQTLLPGIETLQIDWTEPYTPIAHPPADSTTEDLAQLGDAIQNRAIYLSRLREHVMSNETRDSIAKTLLQIADSGVDSLEHPPIRRSHVLEALAQLTRSQRKEADTLEVHAAGLRQDWRLLSQRLLRQSQLTLAEPSRHQLATLQMALQANSDALELFQASHGASVDVLGRLFTQISIPQELFLNDSEVMAVRASADVFSPR